uniref:Replication initiation protein n=1 Tax=Streptomyces sp. NBC_00093 TaxID=2975649 RepID=A0AAU2ACI4_9ACTN
MQTCTCDDVLCQGPALLAADFHYRHLVRAARPPGARKSRRSDDDNHMLYLLLRVATKLEGDSPVLFSYEEAAAELDTAEDTVRAGIAWLVEHRYLALDGQVDGVARLWVNPAVAFLAGTTDPRIAAARHRFPYIVMDEQGMAADQPVHVAEYDEQGWELVYQNNAEQLEDPPRFPFGCPLHHGAVGAGR